MDRTAIINKGGKRYKLNLEKCIDTYRIELNVYDNEGYFLPAESCVLEETTDCNLAIDVFEKYIEKNNMKEIHWK